MNTIAFAVLFILLLTESHATPPIIGKWSKLEKYSDEFDGSLLNRSKWDDHNPKWRGRPPALFSPSNVHINNGNLVLQAKNATLPASERPYRDFTTAAVKSIDKVLYGYFEIRAKPMRSNITSAFWFYDKQPEHWTEIDVFEMAPGKPKFENSYIMNAHVFHLPNYSGTVKQHLTFQETWHAPWNLSDGFHEFGLEWDKRFIRWYVDGNLIREISNVHWHFPLHINFDSETMPDWLGLPEASDLPREFQIDYIRSWKRIEEGLENK